MDGWVDGWGVCRHPAVPRESVCATVTLLKELPQFSPRGFLISTDLFLQGLKDSVKAEYSGPMPHHREGRSTFATKKNFKESGSHLRE